MIKKPENEAIDLIDSKLKNNENRFIFPLGSGLQKSLIVWELAKRRLPNKTLYLAKSIESACESKLIFNLVFDVFTDVES